MIVFVKDEPYRATLDFWNRSVYLRGLNLREDVLFRDGSVPFIMFGLGDYVEDCSELDMNVFNQHLEKCFPERQ